MYVVIAYDIEKDLPRTRVHRLLKDHGTWVQFSVFECDLTTAQVERLQKKLQKLVRADQRDSVRFYFLCAACKKHIHRLGGPIPEEVNSLII